MANTWTSLLDAVYPVGAVYQSWESTSPATLFGGTWTQITSRFLYADNSAGTTGGKSNHFHSLDSDSHHTSWANVDFLFSGNWMNIGYRSAKDDSLTSHGNFSANYYKAISANTIQASTETSWHGITLGGYSQENSETLYPPYITCYTWRRTA